MNDLRERLKKQSTIKEMDVLSDSTFFNDKEMVPTEVPMFNVALSGSLAGGFVPGLITIAGESKNFKTSFALLLAKSFLDRYDDGVVLFYDSEFGTTPVYVENFGIDPERVLHGPITDIEQLKFEVVQQLNELKEKDHVLILIDSLGMLASKKEIEDALKGESKTDMTRAKALKSFFRMITPHLTLKGIPMVVVQHVYQTQSMYPTDVVSGGKGGYLASDTIFIVSRRQEKEGTQVAGFSFVLNVEKSRFVREKSKIPITVMFETGIEKYSGLLEFALEAGFVVKPKMGWYSRVIEGVQEEDKWRESETNSAEFWDVFLNNPKFEEAIQNKYKLMPTKMFAE